MSCLPALCLFLILGIGSTYGQQTITYTNGENNNSGIAITSGTNPTTLTISVGNATQSGAISQSGLSLEANVEKNGTGTLTLNGNNTYNGSTTILAGTLALGTGGSIGDSSGVDLANSNTTFDISGGGNQTIMDLTGVSGSKVNLGANTLTINGRNGSEGPYAGVIQGTGGLNIQATIAVLTGSNTYTGVTTIGAGSELDVNGGSISASSGVNLTGSGATFSTQRGSVNQTIQDLSGVSNTTVALGSGFTEGTANSTTFAGSIVGGDGNTSLTFTKQGAGTLTLTGANTYLGITTINAGTIAIGAGGSDAETTIDLANSGASFDISAGQNQRIEGLNGVSGSTVNLGANTLTVSQLGGQPGGVSNFAGTIKGSGGLIKTNTGILVLTGENTYTGVTTISNGTLQFSKEVSLYSGLTASWTAANLTVSSGGTLALNVGGTGEFTSSDATTLLQNLGTGTGGFANGSSLGFDTSNASGGSFIYAGAVADTHSGSNSLGLVKLGGGSLILSSADTYSGTTTIQTGTLAIGAGASVANSSGIILNNSGTTFDISAGGNQTIQDLSGAPGSTVNLGANTLTAGSSRSTTYSGVLQGSGGLVKQNTGTLTLSGGNTFTGGTAIKGGELSLGSSGALGTTGTISFGGGALQFTSTNTADYSSRFSTAANQLYSFDTNGQSVTLAGNLTSSGGSLSKIGLGTLTLTGANTYTNGTTISGGILQVASINTNLGSGNFTLNGGELLTLATAATNKGVTLSSGTNILAAATTTTVTYNGIVSGAGSLTLGDGNNAGTIALTAANTYTGTTEINTGTLQLGNGGTTGTLSTSSTITDNGNLTIDRSNAVTQGTDFTATAISGSGTFTQAGTGTTTLTSANTYTGMTTISAGVLQLSADNAIQNSTVNLDVANGLTFTPSIGTFTLGGLNGGSNEALVDTARTHPVTLQVGNNNANTTYSGVLSDGGLGGALSKIGTGTFTLTSANTYSGATTISAGTLQLGNGGTTGTLSTSSTITDNGNLTIDRSNVVTQGIDFSATAISGSGTFTQAGTGTTTLTSANTYTGVTTVDFGTLAVQGAGGSIGNSNSIVYAGYNSGDNGTLLISNGGQVTDGEGTVGFATGSTGAVTITGINANGAASTWSNSAVYIGSQGSAALTIRDGGQVNDTNGFVANDPGSSATATITGINVNGTPSLWNNSGYLWVGDAGSGAMTILDGGSVSDQYGTIGYYNEQGGLGTGSVAVSGVNANGTPSTWSNSQDLRVGYAVPGTLTISNGGLVIDHEAYIGYNGGSGDGYGGTATVTGVNANGTPSTWSSFVLNVGGDNPGTLTVQNGGVVNASYVDMGQGEFSGTLNLNTNGVLETHSITAIPGNSAINFNGGILRATADTFSGYYYLIQGGAVTLSNGGGTIDNNGYSVTVNAPIGGSGALTSIGTGTLTLTGANTYTGATTISSGTLYVSGSIVSSTVSVANGATLSGTGTTGFVTVSGGGKIDLQDGMVGTLTVGGLRTGNAGTPSVFSFDIQNISGTTTVDKIVDTGALTLSGAGGTTISVGNLSGTSTLTNAVNTYALLTYTGTQQSLADFMLATDSLDGKALSLSEIGDTVYLDVGTPATISLGNLTTTYNGSPQAATATTDPTGLDVSFTYGGSATVPTNAGSYAVVATINDLTYVGSATGTLVIAKAPATVTLGNLAATANGSPQPATATTNPPGLNVAFTYNGSSAAPSAAGTYTVTGTIDDPNYEGSSTGTLVISPAGTPAKVILSGLLATYNGAAHAVTVKTAPANLDVTVTYNDSATVPVNAGAYAVVATVNSNGYSGTTTGTLVIVKAAAKVTLSSLSATYNTTAHAAIATTTPLGLSVAYTYNGNPTAPTAAGSYLVVATITDPNYTGSAKGTLVIRKGTATVILSNLMPTYDGNPQSATVTTTPTGLDVTTTYAGRTTVPTNAGTYAVVATIDDANYAGTATGELIIAKAMGTVSLTPASLSATYTGRAVAAAATTMPTGLPVSFTYTLNGKTAVPLNAASYAVTARINSPNATGMTTGTLVISPAEATLTINSITTPFTGKPISVTATTNPARLPVSLTYQAAGGSPVTTPPTAVGTYIVAGTVTNPNYTGNSNGTLNITPVAPVATTGAPIAVEALEASMSATVNPRSSDTTAYVEYGTSKTYGSVTATQDVGSGITNLLIDFSTGTLTPQTLYHYRVVATNAGGTAFGADKSFVTPQKPIFADAPAAAPLVNAAGAQVAFAVIPSGVATSVYFRYSTDPNFGTYSQTATQILGAGNAPVVVTGFLGELLPNKTYYYKLVTQSAAGIFAGPVESLMTLGFDTTLVAATGQAAPGTALKYASLGNAEVNAEDGVAFRGTLNGASAATGTGIWANQGTSALNLIARAGSVAPGTDGAIFATLSDPAYNNNCAVAFGGTLKVANGLVTTASASGVWSTSSGSLQLVAREGSIAPGTNGGTFETLSSLGLSDSGGVILLATLHTSTSLGITTANNIGIWEGNSAGDLRLMLRLGDNVGGYLITKLVFPLDGASGTGQTQSIASNKVVIVGSQTPVNSPTQSFASNTGDFVCGASLSDNTSGIIGVIGGIPQVVAKGSQQNAGGSSATNYASFLTAEINIHDRIAFTGTTVPPLLSDSETGIWAENGSGASQVVVATTYPYLDGVLDFSNPVYNDNEAVAFIQTDGDPQVGIYETFIECNSTGTLDSVAQLGGQAPGCAPGVTFSSFGSLALANVGGATNRGGVIFQATLAGTGVTAANNTGIFAVDNTGTLELIVRTGDILDVPGIADTELPKKITTLNFLPVEALVNGQTRSFSPSTGDLVYNVTFSDKSQAIFNVVFP